MTTVTQKTLPSSFSPSTNRIIIEQCNFPLAKEICFFCYENAKPAGDPWEDFFTIAVFTVKPKKEETV